MTNTGVHNYRTGRVVGLAGTAALGGFLFGFDSAVINGAAPAIKSTFGLSSLALGFTVSIALIGSAIGAWFAGLLAEKYGRRRVMLIAATLFIAAAIGQAFPFGITDLLMWRFIGGAGIGVASVMAPMYIAEIAPAQLRGRLASMQQLAIVLGIFATGISNYLILEAAGGDSTNDWLFGIAAWQWMFLVMLVPAIVYGALALRLPESPRYLVEIGKYDEANSVLKQIYTDGTEKLLEDIKASLDSEHRPRLRDLRGKRVGLLPIVWVGVILSALQQFVGINAVFYYSNTIWEAVGFSENQAFQTSLITTGVNVAFTLVAIALVDKVGRKPLLLVGSAGMVAMLATLTYVFGTAPIGPDGNPILTDGPDIVALLAFNAYVAFFAATWGPVVWVLLGEMFPNRIRAAALALATAAQWLANWIVSTAFPPLANISLGLAYSIFTIMAALSIPFVWRHIRETKGVELEKVNVMEPSR
ncbi:MAG TPA: sugar porter family MFS transporter [Candidatus Nanopelagicales bacterium]|nr:sugar porter family MFS transporter [Candidatus Nanopelagicales bacterium]